MSQLLLTRFNSSTVTIPFSMRCCQTACAVAAAIVILLSGWWPASRPMPGVSRAREEGRASLRSPDRRTTPTCEPVVLSRGACESAMDGYALGVRGTGVVYRLEMDKRARACSPGGQEQVTGQEGGRHGRGDRTDEQTP